MSETASVGVLQKCAAVLAAAAVVAAACVLGALGRFPTPEERIRARYPELADVDPSRVERIGKRGDDGMPGMTGHADFDESENQLLALGPGAGIAALRLRLDRALRPVESGFTMSLSWDPAQDASHDTDAWFLHEHPDPACDAVLVRWIGDRDLHFNLRLLAIVAVARPGHAAGAAALTATALDESTPAGLREQALTRLPRCGPVPSSCRTLLARPQDGLDRLAALALGASGDLEAPSHVLGELRDLSASTRREDDLQNARCQLAIESVVRAPPPGSSLRTVAERALTAATGLRKDTNARERASTRAAVGELADAFAAWLDAHPEALQTSFERRRTAYLASDRRRRELALDSFEAISAASPEELDVGAATLTLAAPERRDELLVTLDLLAWSLEDEVRAAPTPRAKLEVLNRRLLRPARQVNFDVNLSSLDEVLRRGAGDCVGWSTLYVALGERLGLPLRAVAVPRHMFVRWDDGETRVNVDPSHQGAFWDDAQYEKGFGSAPRRSTADARHPGLTAAETIAVVCSNFASRAVVTWYPEDAVLWADRALELDPHCQAARWNRFSGLARAELPDRRAVLASLAAARDSDWPVGLSDLAVATLLLDAGFADEALRVARPLPASEDRAWIVAAAAVAAGEADAAREAATALAAYPGRKASPAAVRLAATWLEEGVVSVPDDDARFWLARLFLLAADARPDAARRALELLEADRESMTEKIGTFRHHIHRRTPCLRFPGIDDARRWWVAELRARTLQGDESGVRALRELVDPPTEPSNERR